MVRKSAKEATVRARHKTSAGHSKFYGYDFILLVDPVSRRFTQVGGSVHARVSLYKDNPVHQAALTQTLKQGVYHYEWADQRTNTPHLYQTTCVALRPVGQAVTGVLSFSREIKEGFLPEAADSYRLHDGGGARTFAQILLAARETEKREISKALHDEIGSNAVMLTALLSLVRASVKAGNTEQALQDLAQLDGHLKDSVERLKRVVVSLRPPALENKGGLGGAVRDLLDNISGLAHVPYTFDYDEVDDRTSLSDKVKILLYRIAQEALTNIAKHARAKHIRVTLKQNGPQIYLSVCDDGVGFQPDRQLSIEHVGLLAMKDSVNLLGGTIAIKSAPGKGTCIEVSCPSVIYGG